MESRSRSIALVALGVAIGVVATLLSLGPRTEVELIPGHPARGVEAAAWALAALELQR